jgi:hypothetical protein
MSDDEDDPFADFEKPDDESDPFADLDGAGANDEADETGASDADPAAPFEEGAAPGRLPDDPFTDRPDADRADEPTPRPDAEAGVRDHGDGEPSAEGRGGAEASADDPGSGVDEGAVPDAGGAGGDDPFADLGGGPQPRIEGGESSDDPFETFESVDVAEVDVDEIWQNLGALDETAEQFDGKVFYEVSKHRFCEQCPHFTGPPETQCTFEGTEVVEFVDMETVRLVNCPVVAEQEELGEDVRRYEPE